MVEVDGDGCVRLRDGYSRAEISRHLQEAEGARGAGRGGEDEVVVRRPGAQVGREVDGGQQNAVPDVKHSWRCRLKKTRGQVSSVILRKSVRCG